MVSTYSGRFLAIRSCAVGNLTRLGKFTRLAGSEDVASKLRAQKAVIEERIRTVKIPTIFFRGKVTG